MNGLDIKLDMIGFFVVCLVSGGFDDIGDILWKFFIIILCFFFNIFGLQGYYWLNVVVMVILIVYRGVVVGVKVEVMILLDFFIKFELVK